MALEVEGSSPFIHPISFQCTSQSDNSTSGAGFQLLPITDLGASPSGKARDFDSRTRRFDPCRPSQYDPLAQSAEHLTFNQGVPRSNRGWITMIITTGGRGGIGRRAGFRFQCRKAYEFESLRPHQRSYAVVAQLVERHLAKVEVASPSLVYRSNLPLAGVTQW